MLLAECAYPPGFTRDEWPHLNPETAARIALEAEAVARTIFPETVAGMDDMKFTV